MTGKLYGVGVGPGDPELLTLKAVKIIKQCRFIAVPQSKSGRQVALETCREYLTDKEVLHLAAPMTYDDEKLNQAYSENAQRLAEVLNKGEDAAFLTIGDPSVYSTYTYVERIVKQMGFATKVIPGVPSFCAAAAEAGVPLCERDELLHIIPASYDEENHKSNLQGNVVYMKSGKKLQKLIENLKEQNQLAESFLVENAGMKNQRVVMDLHNLPEDISYLSLVIKKGAK